MGYRAVIGLEVHAELKTASKLFCGCSASFGGEPNTRCCPVCLGFPGVLPVLNERAIEFTIMTALALNCEVAEHCRFARKNYFYPDLPKNYQISQYEEPIGHGGYIEIQVDGRTKRVRVRRVHLEEDTGKSIHTPQGTSLEDFNRCGVPLLEIVSEPDMETPEEARAYLSKLRNILRHLGVCDANMQEGTFRCEPNISVMEESATELGTKVELKNLNSFRAVYQGLEYEIERQIAALKKGEAIIQETRRWDETRGVTSSMRSKEWAHDYRYFPEPDLVPLHITQEWKERLRHSLAEMPDVRRRRFVEQYGLPEYDAEVLNDSKALADFYEECVAEFNEPKVVSNWVMGDFARLMNERGLELPDCLITPSMLAKMLRLQKEGAISGKIAKTVLEEMFASGKDPEQIVQEQGMSQITDEDMIREVLTQVIAENAELVERIRKGHEKAKAFLVGQVMKATRGRANPRLVNKLLEDALSK